MRCKSDEYWITSLCSESNSSDSGNGTAIITFYADDKMRGMADKPPEKLSLADGTVTLYRDTKFMVGAKEVGRGDHMIVQHHTGNEEDIVVVRIDGKDRVKRVVQQMQIQTPSSPALDSTVTFGSLLADLDTETEKRLLAIYKMFSAT